MPSYTYTGGRRVAEEDNNITNTTATTATATTTSIPSLLLISLQLLAKTNVSSDGTQRSLIIYIFLTATCITTITIIPE